jgi:hypothetical protein
MLKIKALVATTLLSSIFGPVSTAQDVAPKDGLTQAELEEMTADILKDIEEMRGKSFVRDVEVSIANKAGFFNYAMERVESMSTPARLNAEETVMKMLGLLDPKVDFLKAQLEMLEEQVGGFYDPATESFCLMDSFQGGLAKVILAHELTHALDDQLYDIDGTLERLEGNGDAQLAYQAVVEGSGTTNMNQWLLKNLDSLSMDELAASGDMGMDSMMNAPECMWKPTLMVYMRGAAFLVRSDNVMMGQANVVNAGDLHTAFSNPPRSTEQILHPEKYWDKEERDEPVSVALDASALKEWNVLYEDTLGEATLALVTTPPKKRGGLDPTNPMALLGIHYTNKAAEGWGGDRYLLLEKEGVLVMHIVTVWDTERDAGEFHASIGKQKEHIHNGLLGMSEGTTTVAAKTTRQGPKEVVVTLVANATPEFDLDAFLSGIKQAVGKSAPLQKEE